MVKKLEESVLLPKLPFFYSSKLNNSRVHNNNKDNIGHILKQCVESKEISKHIINLSKPKHYSEMIGLTSLTKKGTMKTGKTQRPITSQFCGRISSFRTLDKASKNNALANKKRPKTVRGDLDLPEIPRLQKRNELIHRPSTSQFERRLRNHGEIQNTNNFSSSIESPKGKYVRSKKSIHKSDRITKKASKITEDPYINTTVALLGTRRKAFQRVAQYKRSLQRIASLDKQAEEKKRSMLEARRKEAATLQSRKRAEAYAVNAVMRAAFERHFHALLKKMKNNT